MTDGITVNSRQKSVAVVLAAAVLWSIGGLIIKLVALSPMAIAGYRSLFAIPVILLFSGGFRIKFSWDKLFGAVSYASMVILFVLATKATTSANAILLQYTAPVYIAILGGWLLKEKSGFKDWVTIFFVLIGMILFFLDDIGGGSLIGNIFAVISGFSMALNTIFMRRQKDANPLENVLWGSILTVIICSPFMLANIPDIKSGAGVATLGIFQLGMGYVLYSKGIKNLSAIQSIFICMVEPLLNPLWVLLMVGEVPGLLSAIGGIIVLASVTAGNIKPNNRIKPNPAYKEVGFHEQAKDIKARIG